MQKYAALFLVLASLPFAAISCGGSTTQQSNPQQTDGGEEGGVVPEGGSHEGGGADAGHDSGMTQTCKPMNGTLAPGYPAMHGPLPQITYQNGGVLQNPEIVTVTFPGDPLAKQLEEFDDDVLQTCWWDTGRAGYCEANGMNCVGRGVVPAKPHVEMTTPAAASYTDSANGGTSTLQTYIQQQVASGAFPAPDENTIYALYFPSSTSITLDGISSCNNGGFGGYHNSTAVTPPGGSNTWVTYAVIMRCTTTLAEATFAASHEFAEASTDPHVGQNKLGYYATQTNLDYLPWELLLGGGEIGDFCVDILGLNEDQTTATYGSNSWTVTRLWSNANAAAGLDPCMPMSSTETYFTLAPEAGHGTLQMAVGQTQTFTATAYSSGPLTWEIEATDLAQAEGQQAIVQVGLSASSVKNGDSVTVTVTLKSQPPSLGGGFSGEPYLLISAAGQNGPAHFWPMLVVAQ
ncbi:MAG TPA: hypothetical protein VMI75_34680 [Polyangiaceae bacterium]|nr:hypothetical protein [Polyangiaceae bacterium]